MRLSHHAVIVGDLDRALEMYCDHLGMRLLNRQPGVAYSEIALLEDAPNGRRLESLLEEGCEASRLDHVAFEVDDVDGTFQRLAGEGFREERSPFNFPDGTARMAFLRAPDGTRIEIIHPKAPEGTP